MRRRRARRAAQERPPRTDLEDLPDLSGYRSMWLLAMFDLPVTDKPLRRKYARFRRELLTRGFSMLQYSVYARHCASEDSAAGVRDQVRAVLPDEGQVRLVGITDRQFAKMEVYLGKKRAATEQPSPQFMLF